MIPTIDERLASVIRSLTDVIAPSLPQGGGLAHEQIQMCIGHLSIVRQQIDKAPAFELDERHDAEALARALVSLEGYGAKSKVAREALASLLRRDIKDPRTARVELNRNICDLITAASEDSDRAFLKELQTVVLTFEGKRIHKDRIWFAPFGFDTVS
jgi:hypothetical protein